MYAGASKSWLKYKCLGLQDYISIGVQKFPLSGIQKIVCVANLDYAGKAGLLVIVNMIVLVVVEVGVLNAPAEIPSACWHNQTLRKMSRKRIYLTSMSGFSVNPPSLL